MSGDESENVFAKACSKLTPDELAIMVRALTVCQVPVERKSKVMKLELQSVEIKLDGPATYLSWSRRVKRALEGKNLDGYITGEMVVPEKDSARYSLLHTWLLNSMIASIAKTVDGIEAVSDVWGKLMRIYAGIDNTMRVFQIEREIEEVAQRGRSIQEYAADLERLWADYDHFSPTETCMDPNCKKGNRDIQRRTMHFLRHLDPAFEQRSAVLLATSKIPSLEEAISAMIQEESRIGLQAGTGGLPGVKSALAASNLGNVGSRVETRECYNC